MSEEFFPAEPRSLEETGLGLLPLADLALKILYVTGQMTGFELAQAMGLPFQAVLGRVVDFLKRERYCETRGVAGFGEGAYQYSVTEKGSAKAREALWKNQYTGPTPVPLSEYNRAVRAQGLPPVRADRAALEAALGDLVLGDGVVEQLGPAVAGRHSLLIQGAPGNGKTAVARALAAFLATGEVYVPYAVDAQGEIVLVYDGTLHGPPVKDRPAEQEPAGPRQDGRWVRVRRPVVMLGAELHLEALDPSLDEISRCYSAPPQVKANNGVLVLDDLGRQASPPVGFLARLTHLLEVRSDRLAFRAGQRVEVPFEGILIVTTHLGVRELGDVATLRRIRHKVSLRAPTFEEYRKIFRKACVRRGVPYDENALAYLLQRYYVQPKVPLRAADPAEILDRLVDVAAFRQVRPSLSAELLDIACRSYFGAIGDVAASA
ncbi:MAG: ATP-binding protein [Anaerolineae bacterium]|nr:ATP-binding protein [Anaerolineae bacterium]